MPLGVVEVGPVMRQLQEGAKSTGALQQGLDETDGIVRIADHRHLIVDQVIDGVVDLGRHDGEGRDLAEVLGPFLEPELHVLARFLARVLSRSPRARARVDTPGTASRR